MLEKRQLFRETYQDGSQKGMETANTKHNVVEQHDRRLDGNDS